MQAGITQDIKAAQFPIDIIRKNSIKHPPVKKAGTGAFFAGGYAASGKTETAELPIEFDETLWNTLVDHVTVYADERIVFPFMDGTQIAEKDCLAFARQSF